MTTSTRSCCTATGALALFCSILPGQELRVLDGLGAYTATYDAARGRIVAIGQHLETREYDGARWQIAPQPLPNERQSVRLVFDTAWRRTLACRSPFGSPLSIEQYDGIAWRPIAASGAPPERHGFACTFDAQRRQLVLFGGDFVGGVTSNETWTFDGASWTQHTAGVMPPASNSAVSCFDSARGKTVLFDGYGAQVPETWEWNGATWSRVVTTTIPTVRYLPAMGYDPARGRVVMFGGVGQDRLDDVWEFDGVDWHQPIAPNGPSARYGAMCVFDATLGELRVFGGSPSDTATNDMWSWNGVRWLQHPAPPHPGARGVLGFAGVTLADPRGRGMVLYVPNPSAATPTWRFDAAGWHPVGGAAPSDRYEAVIANGAPKAYLHGGLDTTTGSWLSDLWSFDGTAWTLEAANGPPPRIHHAMAYDLARNEVVLFGGVTTLAHSNETWVFDGTRWMQRQPATTPPAREAPMLAYDLGRNRTVLAGGFDNLGERFDTWEWDGVDWTPVTSAGSLSSGRGRMAFDLQRTKVVLVVRTSQSSVTAFEFDGIDWAPIPVSPSAVVAGPFDAVGFPHPDGLLITDLDSVVELSSTAAQVAHYGTACSNPAPDLVANTWPRVGAPHHRIDVQGAPGSSFVALLGAVQSASVPIGGCTLLVQPGQALLLLATSATGVASAALPLPNDRAFLGLDLFFQVAAPAPASPAGFTLSRGLRLQLGD